MKKQFSNKWIASRQRRKQRKYRKNAPLHIKQKFMASNLSKDLRKKMKVRSLQVRKGDKVKVMRGKFAGKDGKVSRVDVERARLSVEGLQRQKKDGTKVEVFFSPSKVQIIEMVDRNAKMKEEKKTEKKETKTGENKNA